MAEKKKNDENLVKVKLPRLSGQNAEQVAFVSVNFKNYIIERGTPVMVPPEVAEVIANSEKAMDEAYQYADEQILKQPK